MKVKVVLILIVIMLAFTIISFAENIGFEDEKRVREYCNSFIEYIVDEEIQKAFDLIEGQWIFSPSEIQSIEVQAIKQLDLVKGRFGNILGYKMLKQEIVGDMFLKYTYIVKYENHIIRWIFIFYKSEDVWLLNTIRFDDSIDKLFTE